MEMSFKEGPQTDNASLSQLWTEVEVSPEKLINPNLSRTILNTIGPINTASTFRVVRSVSQAECLGHFDSTNAYDRALVSVGLCHWTLGMSPGSGSGQYSDAELCAFLAYLASVDNSSFMTYFGNFGVKPDKIWNNISLNSLKTYICWLEVEEEGALYKEYPRTINNKVGDATWFKSWHWYFRFVVGTRTISGVQKAMWGMTRKRISDLRTKEITLQYSTLNISSTPLSDIFTSERANAYLYRWHILMPAGALSTTRLKSILKDAVDANAVLDWSNISNWTNAHEDQEK